MKSLALGQTIAVERFILELMAHVSECSSSLYNLTPDPGSLNLNAKNKKQMSNLPVKAEYAQKSVASSKTSGKAITSLVLGLASFFCALFTGIVAIIFGIIALVDISKSRGRLQGQGLAITGIVLGGIGCFWTLILIGLLLPAVQQVREAARRTTTSNNIRQVALALQNHAQTHRNLPPPVGGEGLSWRVHLLPYLEQNELYKQFHLDEPWDSPHNFALVNQMPDIFKSPNFQLESGLTIYQIPTTPATANPELPHAALVQGQPGPRLGDFRDGLSKTILVLEVDPQAAVVWTDPNGDWMYDPSDPFRSLGKTRRGFIVAGFADCRVESIKNTVSPRDMNALITRDGSDVANNY